MNQKQGRPSKDVIERNTHSEIFLELAWRTNPEHELLMAMGDVKDKPERIKAFGIGLTRGELIESIKEWNELIDKKPEKFKRKGANYSKKLTNLLKAGLIEKVDYPFRNKKIRYVLSKRGIIKELMGLIVNNKAILLKLLYNDKLKDFFEITPDSKNFDKGVWKLLISYLREIYRYRYDAKNYKKSSSGSKLAISLEERDAQVTQSTIKDYFVHFIFQRGMMYHTYLVTGKPTKFWLGGSIDNAYYNDFLKLCLYYVGNNILKFELARPFLEVEKTKAPKNVPTVQET